MNNLLQNIITIAGNIKKGVITMHYKKDSETVRAWVDKIRGGERTLKQVPNLFNLRKIVKEVLDELAAAETSVEAEQEG